jgi:hypothetical protein
MDDTAYRNKPTVLHKIGASHHATLQLVDMERAHRESSIAMKTVSLHGKFFPGELKKPVMRDDD